jgi:hypothetical protein
MASYNGTMSPIKRMGGVVKCVRQKVAVVPTMGSPSYLNVRTWLLLGIWISIVIWNLLGQLQESGGEG